MDAFCVHRILDTVKITDYLDERGFFPVKRSGGKLMYHCPIHTGDNDPSFVVYLPDPTNKDGFQNFYCYGCHAGSTVINLMSAMEDRTPYEVYNSLLKSMNVNSDDRTQWKIANVREFDETLSSITGKSDVRKCEHLFIDINGSIRMHLERLDHDDEEVLFWEKLYPLIDRAARKGHIETLTQISDYLADGFLIRVEEYEKRQLKIGVDNPWKI